MRQRVTRATDSGDAPAEGKRPGTANQELATSNPLTAGGWSGLSFIVANVIGGLVYLPLARRLGPDEFGLFAEANLLYMAAALLAEGAVAQAIVQMRGDRRELAQAGLWLATVLGLLGAVVCVLAAPAMVAIYGDGTLLPLLLLLAPGVLLAGLGAAPHALLSRELDFRRKTLPETLGIGLGGVAGLAAAFAGLGVYSLATMALVQTAVSTAVAWHVTGLRPRRTLPDGTVTRRMATFTATLGAGDLALYARLNTDYALTGRLLGTAPLGVYTLAWATSAGPQLFIASFTGRVGYALFARLQLDADQLRRVFLSGLRVIAAAAVPVSAGAVIVTPDLVPVALGSRWEAATGPVMVLFGLQLIRTVCAPGASLILAMGRGRQYALVGAAALPATVVAVLLGTHGGVTGVAWAMLAAVGGTSLVYLLLACRALHIGTGDLARALALPLALAAASAPAIALVRAALSGPVETPAALRLAVSILAGVLAGLPVLRVARRSLRADLRLLRDALPERVNGAGGTGGHEMPAAMPGPDS